MVILSICTALYEYAPQTENELAISEGDLLYILEKSGEDDWWKAKKRALPEDEDEPIGLIPNNYVEPARPTHQARALFDYGRQTDEEVSFEEEAILDVYDKDSDPDWVLVGLGSDYGFAPANYIEIVHIGQNQKHNAADVPSGGADMSTVSPDQAPGDKPEEEAYATEENANIDRPTKVEQATGPAATLASVMQNRTVSKSEDADQSPVASLPSPASQKPDPAVPDMPERSVSQQAETRSSSNAGAPMVASPRIMSSPPQNRVAQSSPHPRSDMSAGFQMYHISEMVSTMGKSKKLPMTLGINLSTGVISISADHNGKGTQQQWTADKLTHYSIESKHVFVELVKPSRSFDLHAGAKETAQEIVSKLGELAGTARAGGLREILEVVGSGQQKKGKILYDFVAQGDDEVTVGLDDEIVILDDTQSNEWWMVRRLKTGQEGVVPSSYVEITGTIPTSSTNAARSVVEQNRQEEERLAREALRSNGGADNESYSPPQRASSQANGDRTKGMQKGKGVKFSGKGTPGARVEPDTSKLRTWTDRTGAFKVEAQFIGLKDGKIHLHKLNGVKIAVPVSKMAVEDLEYVEQATGQSLDDDKPLSEIRRRNTQRRGDGHSHEGPSTSRAGASIESPRPPPKDRPEYDWFDFFLKAGVSPHQCERYAYNFNKDSMDENILPDVTSSVLRTLGLKEGDILRVMKYLDVKFGRNSESGLCSTSKTFLDLSKDHDGKAKVVDGSSGADRASASQDSNGGLFSGSGGSLINNTRKSRPAPPVQSNDVIDENAFKPKRPGLERVTTPLGPPTPLKDGFEDDAWDLRPSRRPSAVNAQIDKPAGSTTGQTPTSPQQHSLSSNLLDLSLLQEPLKPSPTASSQNQGQAAPITNPPAPNGANPAFFQAVSLATNQPAQTGLGIQARGPAESGPSNGLSVETQNSVPRQRPRAPPAASQPAGALMPPPPPRPFSTSQTQPQNSSLISAPLQPQFTSMPALQVAAPGQSLHEISQQRQQQFLLQQQQQQPPQHHQSAYLQPQQTGHSQLSPSYTQFPPGQQGPLMTQFTGFNPQTTNPYVNGQQAHSPFADPRMHLQPQQTGYQSGFQSQLLQPQATGYQNASFQPQTTGSINSMLPPALQPQPTGLSLGNSSYSRPPFGQPPPPNPPSLSTTNVAPLTQQKTGPAPSIRFGPPAANKLQTQPTGRKANLGNATPDNPFGF